MKKKPFFRFDTIYLLFVFLFLILFVKIISLQIYRQDFFDQLAKEQHYGLFQIQGKRGKIIDSNRDVLAKSIYFYSVFADPLFVDNKNKFAEILSTKLNISKERLIGRLNKKKRRFVWVKRKINWKQKKDIENLNLAGVGFIRENQRFYPEKSLFSSVLGIVDIDNNGLEGIELYYDQYLRGKKGWARVLRDSTSQHLILTPSLVELQKGADLVVTLDTRIQYWVKQYLKETIKKYRAKKGSVVVMNAQNGEILALANSNSSGLNNDKFYFRKNSAVTDMFEPGSVFKVVTLAAAISQKRSFDKIDCEQGRFKIPGTVLNDWRPYGDLSFQEVFYKSSNIGVAKIATTVGYKKIYNYIKKMGFGQKTGIDFPGESQGRLMHVDKWSKTARYIVPIGQGIGVNLLQLVRAFAVIANGGDLVTPHLGKELCAKGLCRAIEYDRKKNILSARVANQAKRVLIKVVEQGTGKRAKIDEERIGGKTGTAQKFDSKLGRYSSSKYRANFIGFIDSSKKPIVIGVTIDEPKRSHFGGVVAAPLFKKIAKKIISYELFK
ncbi:MAG: penicillin-binding protein 2 [Candidatus Omnitrophica bacterium]|nr:penicillin-binding protein 2 [Candidatus Omnitrophota bacterium]MCF7893585.1 penicillin-binding protein 2 [Candidatus Omnitrophota bacterium]